MGSLISSSQTIPDTTNLITTECDKYNFDLFAAMSDEIRRYIKIPYLANMICQYNDRETPIGHFARVLKHNKLFGSAILPFRQSFEVSFFQRVGVWTLSVQWVDRESLSICPIVIASSDSYWQLSDFINVIDSNRLAVVIESNISNTLHVAGVKMQISGKKLYGDPKFITNTKKILSDIIMMIISNYRCLVATQRKLGNKYQDKLLNFDMSISW